MPAETGGGNYPPPTHDNLEGEVRRSWDVWENRGLKEQVDECFPGSNNRDLSIANHFAAGIVKNHQYFLVNIGKNNNVYRPQYEWNSQIDSPGLETPEQRKSYVDGVVKGLSWLEDVPKEVRNLTLNDFGSDFVRSNGSVLRVIPLWEDKTKPINRQCRVLINFTGFTFRSSDPRGTLNRYSMIYTIQNPEKSNLNEIDEYHLRLMRVLPFSLRSAAYVLNPEKGKHFFDSQNCNADGQPTHYINFIHKFAGSIPPLPNAIHAEASDQGDWNFTGKNFSKSSDSEPKQMADFAAYTTKEIARPDPTRGGTFDQKVKQLIPDMWR